jgi:hypothetical protein
MKNYTVPISVPDPIIILTDPEIGKSKLRIRKANLLRIGPDPDPTWQFLWSLPNR